MDDFMDFIGKYGSHVQLVVFVTLLCVLWNLENLFGIVVNYRKWIHGLRNALFALANLPGQLMLGLFFVEAIEWTGENHFGILHILGVQHKGVAFLCTFILLDLGEYVYHVIMHKIRRLWMFHLVHHTDAVVDVSTTLREHPGENFIRLSFTLLWVFLSGACLWALMIRQVIQAFATLFAHMNYRLPEKTDKIISLLFITPNLHQVHHHFKQPYTDCNYGDVLSIWDRLFGTLKILPAEKLVFGVDAYIQQTHGATFKSLILVPFGKYRKNEAGKSLEQDKILSSH